MDKRITFRFYRVERIGNGRLSFEDSLQQISNIPSPRDRERVLAADYHVRAEIIERHQGSVQGELTRVQRTNFPSEVRADGRRPLRIRNPLGHGVVFRYLPGTGEIGLQYDPRVLSPSKFTDYLNEIIEGARFRFRPIVREDMWERFNQGTVRKISISIAQPEHLTALDRGGAASVSRSMRDMAEAYSSPNITIELSMGHRQGSLSNAVKSMVGHFRGQAVGDVAQVSSIRARVQTEDEGSEDLNLLDDFLSTKDVLELHNNDPEVNYRIKLAALREKMREWL